VVALKSEAPTISFSKVQFYAQRHGAQTAKGREKRIVMLESAAAQRTLAGTDARGPFIFFPYDAATGKFGKRNALSKSSYREVLVETIDSLEGESRALQLRFFGARAVCTMASRSMDATEYRPRYTSGLLYGVKADKVTFGATTIVAQAVVVDAMFMLHYPCKIPMACPATQQPVLTGSDCIAWFINQVLLRSKIVVGVEEQQFCFDPQAPFAKAATERHRDAGGARRAGETTDLTIAEHLNLRTRQLFEIVECREHGRQTFLSLLAELTQRPDWVSANVRFPPGVRRVQISGASRSRLGETVVLEKGAGGTVRLANVGSAPLWHEEADTMVIAAALRHAEVGRTVLISCPDNDCIFAGMAGLASYLTRSTAPAREATVRRLHMQMTAWHLKSDGRRAVTRVEQREDRTVIVTDLLWIGEITLAIMTEPCAIATPPGEQRVKTLVWCAAFFGGDTVPQIYGYTPRTGLAALKLLGDKLRLPQDGHGAMGVSEQTLRAAELLVKAAAYMRRPSTFLLGGRTPAEFVEQTTIEDVGFAVYEWKSDSLSYQVASGGEGGQVYFQAMKMNKRYTEWERSWMQKPNLLIEVLPKPGAIWPQHPESTQLEALYIHTPECTSRCAFVGCTDKCIAARRFMRMDTKNVVERMGLGVDVDAYARRVVEEQRQASAPESEQLLRDEAIRLLTQEQLEQLPHTQLRQNIRARHTDETRHMGVGGSLRVSAEILRALVESQILEAEGGEEMSVEAGAPSGCPECGMSCPAGRCMYA